MLSMLFKDEELFKLIERLSTHFRTNVANHFTERMLSAIPLDAESRVFITELTEREESYRGSGYHPDDLYRQLFALARYIFQIRREVLPHIRTLSPSRSSVDQADRIRRDMAISNFGPNLAILSDMLLEIYLKVVALDTAASGKKAPAYTKHPDIRELKHYLVD